MDGQHNLSGTTLSANGAADRRVERPGAPLRRRVRGVLQLRDLPRAAPSPVRARAGRGPVAHRRHRRRLDRDRHLRQDAGGCAVRHPRTSAPAPGGRPGVRAHAVHLPRCVDARRADRAPRRARLRHRRLWSGGVGHGVRSGPPRPAGRLARHVCHGAGRGSGAGPGAGRVPHRRWSIRPRVHRGGSRRARGAPDRRHLVAVPSGPRYAPRAGQHSGPASWKCCAIA